MPTGIIVFPPLLKTLNPSAIASFCDIKLLHLTFLLSITENLTWAIKAYNLYSSYYLRHPMWK